MLIQHLSQQNAWTLCLPVYTFPSVFIRNCMLLKISFNHHSYNQYNCYYKQCYFYLFREKPEFLPCCHDVTHLLPHITTNTPKNIIGTISTTLPATRKSTQQMKNNAKNIHVNIKNNTAFIVLQIS
jgi:hypothetical protein